MSNLFNVQYDYKISVKQGDNKTRLQLREFSSYALTFLTEYNYNVKVALGFDSEQYSKAPEKVLKQIINSEEFDAQKIMNILFEYVLIGVGSIYSVNETKIVLKVGFIPNTPSTNYPVYYITIEDKDGINRRASEYARHKNIKKFRIEKSQMIFNHNIKSQIAYNKYFTIQHTVNFVINKEIAFPLERLDKEANVNSGYQEEREWRL